MKGRFFKKMSWTGEGKRAFEYPKIIMVAYLLVSIGIGYLGAFLVYSGVDGITSAHAQDTAAVADKFNVTCGVCHPDGGNTFKPHLALKKAPQLEDMNEFLSYIRSPKARDGSQTMMPPFASETLPDEEAKAIYEYIVQDLK